MTIILFLVVLFVLILVHEWGHYIVAKRTGMRVDEFGIGFPPKLFGVKKGETEYTFNALPIGGFVRIYGEQATDVEEEDPDRARAFGARPRWAQALVLIAGVTMNVLFAWLLIFGTYVIGSPTAVSEADASPEANLLVTEVLNEGPLSGQIPVGSIINSISYEGDTLLNPTPSAFSDFVNVHPNNELEINYDYGRDNITTTVVPVAGLMEENGDKVAVGIGLVLIDNISYGPLTALKEATIDTYSMTVAILNGLSSLVYGAFTGEADLSQVAGPVGIVGLVGDAAAFGLTALMTFVAIISLNLAVINMLPVPALDGGRLVFVAIEAVLGREIDPVWSSRINFVGFVLLMLLMVTVTYSDITKLL